MRVRTYLLTAIGATVVVGGLYLWLDVRETAGARPSDAAVAEAQARHARSAERSEIDRPLRRPPRAPDPERAPVPTAAHDLPRPRGNIPLTDPKVFDAPPPTELTDRQRGGVAEPPIDPDNPELASAMTESNKMYDRGDFEGARALALKLLDREPDNVRMLRVVVSSSCIMGDADVAAKLWTRLPPADQAQMSQRCARYQVSFPTERAAPTEK